MTIEGALVDDAHHDASRRSHTCGPCLRGEDGDLTECVSRSELGSFFVTVLRFLEDLTLALANQESLPSDVTLADDGVSWLEGSRLLLPASRNEAVKVLTELDDG